MERTRAGRERDDWSLDPAARELHGAGGIVRLAEKPCRVLVALVDADGAVVPREDLRKRLWPDDTFVDFENNLNSAVATLRRVLGDSARQPRFIETIPKAGYRLIGPVRLGSTPRSPLPAARGRSTSEPATLAQRGHAVDASRSRRDGAEPARDWTHVPVAAAVFAAGLAVLVAVAVSSLSIPAREGAPGPGPGDAAVREDAPNRDVGARLERGRYLRAQYLIARQSTATLRQALEAFREAGRLAPRSPAPLAEEADTLVELAFAGGASFTDTLALARERARQAVALDGDTADARRVMGMAALFLDWDVPGAARWIDGAVRRAPQSARNWLARATYLSASGRHAAAVEAAERAVALEPAAYYVRADLAMFYLAAGRHADAAASSRDVLQVAPDFEPALGHALTAAERQGQWGTAAGFARQLLARAGAPAALRDRVESLESREAVRAWREWDLARFEDMAEDGRLALPLALRYASSARPDEAIRQLERALARREPLMVFVRAFPELKPLSGSHAFERLAARVAP